MQATPASAAVAPALRLGRLDLHLLDVTVIVLALLVALFAVYRLWRIAQREHRQQRVEALRADAADRTAEQPPPEKWYSWLGGLVAASPIVGRAEQRRLLDTLAKAGFRQHGSLATLVAAKLGIGGGLTLLVWLLLAWNNWLFASALVRSIVLVAVALLGWRLPDFTLGRLAARRRLHLEQGMPDALDLLVICAEAGLSLDQAIDQVGRDLKFSHPEIAEELAITAAELRVVSDRGAALENLARRTRLETLRSITATLTQAIRFGTPIAESLRILAAEMRSARLLRIEERAARLPVLLTIPLMAFIMPALFIVIATPVALRVSDFFRHLQIGAGVL
jgi:tight adherence protein C